MQVKIEDVSPVEKKLVVEVPWATVSSKLDQAYRELGRTVNLRGFRKGKVPKSVLRRMYGKHVRADVISQLVREGFSNAVELATQAVAEPRLAGEPAIKKGEPFSFEAIVEVKGEVVAKDYDNLRVERRPYEVPDEEVQGVLESIRREHTELLPIEGRDVTARTDVVTVAITGTIGEERFDRPQMHVDLSEPENELLPGLVAALTGVPMNLEDHEVELVVPEDYRITPWAGQTAKLSITISDARKKEVPELDDELAQDAERGETLEEMRQSVTDELAEQRRKAIQSEMREAALKALVENNEIPVAESLIERGVEFQFERMQMMLGMWNQTQGKLPLDDDIRERLRPSAIETVRGELLLEAVAEQEEVEVTQEEIDAHIEELAKERGMGVAIMRAELQKGNQLESVRYNLRRDKILDLLLERAEVVEVEPGAHDHDHDHDHGEASEEPEPVAAAQPDESDSVGAPDDKSADE